MRSWRVDLVEHKNTNTIFFQEQKKTIPQNCLAGARDASTLTPWKVAQPSGLDHRGEASRPEARAARSGRFRSINSSALRQRIRLLWRPSLSAARSFARPYRGSRGFRFFLFSLVDFGLSIRRPFFQASSKGTSFRE
jgi:hypothetical protein